MSTTELNSCVPKKYHSYISGKPTKVTNGTDLGIVAYAGEPNVQHVTYEFGTAKSSQHTIVLPALINRNENANLQQISVIIHY